MGLESLKPEMPTLEEFGLDLYRDMIDCERTAILNIHNSTAWYFKEHCNIAEKKPVKLIDQIANDKDNVDKATRGKILVITEPDFDYQSLIDELYHSRREFYNYLQIQKERQKINAKNVGLRSTADPEIINFIANEITYSHNSAYCSAKLTIDDIDYLISQKIENIEESIDSSRASRQHARVERYEQRIDQLRVDYEKLKNIVENTTIVGRRRSGEALKLRATNHVNSKPFGIKNVSIIYSHNHNDVILKPVNTHYRKSEYGACLLEIEELRLEIYAAPTIH